MKFKRMISGALALLLVVNTTAFAAESTQNETVKFIVELKETSVLEEFESGNLTAFTADTAAEKKAERLMRTQSTVQNEIEENIDKDAQKGFNYTHVLNGFSMEGTAEDMAKIAELPEVKAVYPVQTYEAPPDVESDDITNCCSEMNIEYLRNNGISGQGQVIAVIDGGFDARHEMFSGDIEGAKYSKTDMANLIANNDLSCENGRSITANRVYVSEKIPFAFNYANKSADVNNGSVHGTHVAGIAAGNNGKDIDGTRLTGAAPDAQLLFMAVQEENKENLDDDAILAAFDDAAKLGADVVNCSFAYPFITESELHSKAVESLQKAGINLSVSAGNMGRGICKTPGDYNNYYYGTDAENIDYGSIGLPNFPATTTIAAAEAEIYRNIYNCMYVDGNEIAFQEQNPKYLFSEKFCDKEYEFVYCNYGTAEDTEDIDINGKIAVIDRGKPIIETAANLASKGAVGVVLINYDETVNINADPDYLNGLPYACISNSDRDKLLNAQNKHIRTGQKAEMDANPVKGMCLFTSWGNMRNMELKPEITAPGGEIYSSVPDDQYKNKDGTSMAAPHAAGSFALVRQAILNDKNKYGITDDTNIGSLAEKLLMSGGSIIYRDGIPASPRQQGAGMVNLESAVKTNVILSTDSELDNFKPKLSLGETGENFTLAFNAENISSEPVEYDNCRLVVITDDADEDGKITDMRSLSFTSDMPEKLTVNANSTQKISVNVTLDKNELNENLKVFKNGFYIDGFVILSSNNADIPELSLPFTGFYGGWDTQSPLDKGYYNDPLYNGNKLTTNYTDSKNAKTNAVLGTNVFWSKDIYGDTYDEFNSEEFAGISPNNDNYFDALGIEFMPARKIGSYGFTLYNYSDGSSEKIPLEEEKGDNLPKWYDIGHNFKLTDIEDGEYTVTITATNYGSDKKFESDPLKFYVDTQKPEITECELYEEDGKTLLKLGAKDDRHLMGFTVTGNLDGGEEDCLTLAINGSEEAETTFDVTDMDPGSLKIAAYDYAYNCEKYLYGDINGDGTINDIDAALLLKHISGILTLTPEQSARADVHKDDSIDMLDVIAIQNNKTE
ncbi:MAG: S8 family serine peptidase [Firmicutes bacterium]|nr:S8 family serine peptidase [Bacillota bacterium]